MWIDTHCHLDAIAADGNDAGVAIGDAAPDGGAAAAVQAVQAAQAGVSCIVIPAVATANFAPVAALARQQANCVYALGIHPIFVPHAHADDLLLVRRTVEAATTDAKFVAIGEIGLDFFIPALCTPEMRDKQEFFYREQLKIARDFDLPVLLHVRRSQDQIVKHLRQIAPHGGIAHAFNGSAQQAKAFLNLGFKFGFGGAMTFTRALQIRRLAVDLPLDALVLETDAPDISPAWLHPQANSPAQLPRIGAVLAELRGLTPYEVARATWANALVAMPRLADLGSTA